MQKYKNTNPSKRYKKIHLENQSGLYETQSKTSGEADCGYRNAEIQI